MLKLLTEVGLPPNITNLLETILQGNRAKVNGDVTELPDFF